MLCSRKFVLHIDFIKFTLPVWRISPLKCIYLWDTHFNVKVLFCYSNFCKIFIQCNISYCSLFCITKLDWFYNTLARFVCYFHRVSLICSADNIFMRKVIIIHYIYCNSDVSRDFGEYRFYLKSLNFSDMRSPPYPPHCGAKRQKNFQFNTSKYWWKRHLKHFPVILLFCFLFLWGCQSKLLKQAKEHLWKSFDWPDCTWLQEH